MSKPAAFTGNERLTGIKNYDIPLRALHGIPVDMVRYLTSVVASLNDVDKLGIVNSASPVNYTIPTDATLNFPIGAALMVMWYGAGKVTVVAAGGVSIRTVGGGLVLPAQFAWAGFVKIAANEWASPSTLSLT